MSASGATPTMPLSAAVPRPAAREATQLPWFYGATFIATLALAPVFGALVSRYPRRVVVPAVYGFFIACLIGFIPLIGWIVLIYWMCQPGKEPNRFGPAPNSPSQIQDFSQV